MRPAALFFLLLLLAAVLSPQQPWVSFREQQLAYPRVKTAAYEEDAELRALFA